MVKISPLHLEDNRSCFKCDQPATMIALTDIGVPMITKSRDGQDIKVTCYTKNCCDDCFDPSPLKPMPKDFGRNL